VIAAILLAALSLPDDVGAPPPGDFTLMLSYAERPIMEVRAGLTDWLGVQIASEITSAAPLISGALRVAAADGRRTGLFAHTELLTNVRPRFDSSVMAGFDVGIAVGLIGRWGPMFLRFDGGLVLGVAIEPTADAPRTVDQQGGLFTTQRLTLGVDFARRLRIDVYGHVAVPSSAFFAEEPDEEALRVADATFGARVGVRF
jgi:hypothetical protein